MNRDIGVGFESSGNLLGERGHWLEHMNPAPVHRIDIASPLTLESAHIEDDRIGGKRVLQPQCFVAIGIAPGAGDFDPTGVTNTHDDVTDDSGEDGR